MKTKIWFFVFTISFVACDVSAREAAFAGKFYPADKAELTAFVDKALAAAPAPKADSKVIAILAPHAGYPYSGRAAAYAYKLTADSYDLVVILSTAHTKSVKGAALLASGFYETPLGRVPVDEKLSRELIKADPLFTDDAAAHLNEHAVEVQLPFLQRRLKKPFKLVAGVMNSENLPDLLKVGRVLASKLKGRKVLLVISSDMSHYPEHETARAVDLTQALALQTMSPEYFQLTGMALMSKGVAGLETCACGSAAITAGLEAAKQLGAGEFVNLKYGDSYDEAPEISEKGRVVGYLAGVFIAKPKAEPYKIKFDAGRKDLLLKTARAVIAEVLAGSKPRAELEKTDYALNLPAAVFVTLTKSGALRGCIGTIEPQMALLDAVKYAAISAAFSDHRFEPLTKEELPGIKIEISALSRLERVASAKNITPVRHGVVVRNGGQSGLFLPQVWEQIPGKEDFLSELCSQKAGLPRDCWKDPKTELYTFTVEAFKEK
ncbi:MAG: AmmeMemoRadiSam system protein B [Elusimicrobia bacterium]|nr:AmmeMemoRadiSam system protein B [Elusimicrobiota bacterium]